MVELPASFACTLYTQCVYKYGFKLPLLRCHNDSPLPIRVVNVFSSKITHAHRRRGTSWAFRLHLIFQNDPRAALTLCLITPIKRGDFFVMQFVSNKHDGECRACCRLRLMQGFNSACNYSFGRHLCLHVALPCSEESWRAGRSWEKLGGAGVPSTVCKPGSGCRLLGKRTCVFIC